MWIRKLYRTGNSVMVTIPRDVMRVWEARYVRNVQIIYDPPRLILTPLTMDELMRRPAQEDEELPADAIPDAES